MAWMPPYVAQVPTARTARALGARRSSHSLVVIGWPVAGLLPKPHQYPSSLICLVGDRSFNDQHERIELAPFRLIKPLDEVVRAPRSDRTRSRSAASAPRSCGKPGKRAQDDLLDARLRGGGERHRIPIATQPGIDPQHMDERFLCLEGGGRRHRSHLSHAGSAVTHAAGAGRRPTSAASPVLTFGPELSQANPAPSNGCEHFSATRRTSRPGRPRT